MKWVFFIHTALGVRRLSEADFPLSIGGAGADITLPGSSTDVVRAHIALSSGHAYIQPANETVELFHNHEFISTSAWLKSGDRIQLEEWTISWDVKGDQVFVKARLTTEEPVLQPPAEPPPAVAGGTDDAIITLPAARMSAGKLRTLRYVVVGLFGLLSLVALFVLLATPIAVRIDPEPDTQSVAGFPPPVSFGSRMLVVPGTYNVLAGRTGYQPLDQSIEVGSDGFQAFSFELRELPGRLKILVDPRVPIRVFSDDSEAPVDADNIAALERGTQRLRIETERYQDETQEIEIAGFGELQEISIALKPAWASVQLDSQPQGAQVLVDGEVLGTTLLNAEILQGQRSIELSLPGFKTARLEEMFVAGTSPVLDIVNLQPNDGTLVLASRPKGAIVSVSGSFKGSTPITMVLASGIPHQLQLSKPGYLSSSKTVYLHPDEKQQLTIDLSPEFGIVFLNTEPADASLKLDGKAAGNGTQRLQLTTRPHELVFSKPGYVSETINVTPRTDTSQNVDVRLKTETQAKEDARPALLRTAGGQEMHLLEPQGSFKMGASRREAGRRANESQRLVELTKPFYLASREVTNAEYRLYDSKHNSGSAEGVSLNADNLPVANVSWDEAARYCNWLSEKDQLKPAYIESDGHMQLLSTANTGYRLPSEAEWVYAARVSGRQAEARYPWDGTYPPTAVVGNFADAQIADTLANVVTGYNDGYRGPAPVASFSAEPTGFYDLGGNVSEWINDFYAVYPGQADVLVKDPTGPASGDHHVIRGSSWRDGSITELRLSYRDYSREPRDNLGFRIARYVNE